MTTFAYTIGVPGSNNRFAVQAPLFVGRNFWISSTADQQMTKIGNWTTGVITQAYAHATTGTVSSFSQGGLYTGAGKTGLRIIESTQSYANLTTPNQLQPLTLFQTTSQVVTSNVFVSLSSTNTTSLVADFWLLGLIMD